MLLPLCKQVMETLLVTWLNNYISKKITTIYLLENTINKYDLTNIKYIIKENFNNKKLKLTKNARINLEKFNKSSHKRIRDEILNLCD